MAVPTSGELSLRGIRAEIGTNNYNSSVGYTNVSLTGMSTGLNGTINTANASANRPNGTVPHLMSEFYSYDHDIVSVTAFEVTPSSPSILQVCGNTPNSTLYHDGSSTLPGIGDTVYSNSAGTTAVSAGHLATSTTTGIVTDVNGEVSEVYLCSKRSERRLKYNIEFIGDSPMGIPMYHFNYKDESHGKGRFVGAMVDDLERLGFEKVLIRTDDGIFVNYDKIDVPFHNVTI